MLVKGLLKVVLPILLQKEVGESIEVEMHTAAVEAVEMAGNWVGQRWKQHLEYKAIFSSVNQVSATCFQRSPAPLSCTDMQTRSRSAIQQQHVRSSFMVICDTQGQIQPPCYIS